MSTTDSLQETLQNYNFQIKEKIQTICCKVKHKTKSHHNGNSKKSFVRLHQNCGRENATKELWGKRTQNLYSAHVEHNWKVKSLIII